MSFKNPPPCFPNVNPAFPYDRHLQAMTSGKQLLYEDLPFSREQIQLHYENGYIIFRNGLEYVKKAPRCVRCGNTDSSWFGTFPCSRCGEICTYCRKCIMMGRISSCTKLISWNGPEPNVLPKVCMDILEPSVLPSVCRNAPELRVSKMPNGPEPSLVPSPCSNTIKSTLEPTLSSNAQPSLLEWSGRLSEGQTHASIKVAEAVHNKNELLVWAVCGAGKTEILFAGIEKALQNGERVCIATPRTDVVLELTPRLQAAFPAISVASLYGGSPDRHLFARLTIATTHQLLRFYHAFDTVIVDEVDAFPYSVDETLQYAVQQARKPYSSLIYLTATPNQKYQTICRQGKMEHVMIPARFHRHPLPVPELVWCGNWSKSLKRNKLLPKNVLLWLEQRVKERKQALLFLPKIELIEELLPILKAKLPSVVIEGVHSEDPNRKDKVIRMRKQEISLMLTTTILERGVTFPNIDVAVLGAEDEIFSESALVQIAGRVGRSIDFPNGTITFFHYGKTKAMVRAYRQITTMNQKARRLGLIN